MVCSSRPFCTYNKLKFFSQCRINNYSVILRNEMTRITVRTLKTRLIVTQVETFKYIESTCPESKCAVTGYETRLHTVVTFPNAAPRQNQIEPSHSPRILRSRHFAALANSQTAASAGPDRSSPPSSCRKQSPGHCRRQDRQTKRTTTRPILRQKSYRIRQTNRKKFRKNILTKN